MSKTKLYLSPHLDDVVFSCAGRIQQDVTDGYDVTVATIFSSGSDLNPQEYDLRKAEDQKALALLGAEPLWLDLPDAPYRTDFYNSFRRIILERDSADNSAFTAKVQKEIENMVATLTPSEIIAPLAVGTHIDHRIVHEAAMNLQNSIVSYYEERPYAFTLHGTAARLQSLGAYAEGMTPLSGAVIESHIESLCSLQYIRQYLPEGEEKSYSLGVITQRIQQAGTSRLRAEHHVLLIEEDQAQKALEAVGTYKSQIRDFFGSMEEYIESARYYSQSMNALGLYAERYWRITPLGRN